MMRRCDLCTKLRKRAITASERAGGACRCWQTQPPRGESLDDIYLDHHRAGVSLNRLLREVVLCLRAHFWWNFCDEEEERVNEDHPSTPLNLFTLFLENDDSVLAPDTARR